MCEIEKVPSHHGVDEEEEAACNRGQIVVCGGWTGFDLGIGGGGGSGGSIRQRLVEFISRIFFEKKKKHTVEEFLFSFFFKSPPYPLQSRVEP